MDPRTLELHLLNHQTPHHSITTMTPIPSSQLLSAHQWRYAVKKFDPTKKIPAAEWATLEETLVLSPSSFGLQPWKFLVVTNPALKEQLKTASWNQAQLVEASHVVAFAVQKEISPTFVDDYIQSIATTRQQPLDAPGLQGLKKVILEFLPLRPNLEWNTRQAYIALGNLMTTAALLGIDSCPMEGIEAAQYDEILGLKGTNFAAVVACTLGYRAADDKYATLPKVRFPHSQMIQHFN
jgi:nitroreductase